jgi:hypothetical protein
VLHDVEVDIDWGTTWRGSTSGSASSKKARIAFSEFMQTRTPVESKILRRGLSGDWMNVEVRTRTSSAFDPSRRCDWRQNMIDFGSTDGVSP